MGSCNWADFSGVSWGKKGSDWVSAGSSWGALGVRRFRGQTGACQLVPRTGAKRGNRTGSASRGRAGRVPRQKRNAAQRSRRCFMTGSPRGLPPFGFCFLERGSGPGRGGSGRLRILRRTGQKLRSKGVGGATRMGNSSGGSVGILGDEELGRFACGENWCGSGGCVG